jgi:hypothetical protein
VTIGVGCRVPPPAIACAIEAIPSVVARTVCWPIALTASSVPVSSNSFGISIGCGSVASVASRL